MQLVLIKLKARTRQAVRVQEILTKHGCDISVRLGLHEDADSACSEDGLIILKVKADQAAVSALVADLNGLQDIIVKAVSL